MRRLILGVALLAVLASSAIAASAAFAEEGLLPTPVTFTGTSGKGTLEDIKGNKITCSSDEVLGAEFTTDKSGKYTDIHFKGCKAFGLFGANSVGDPAETILTGGGTLTLCLINSATLEFGVVIELSKTVVIEVPAAGSKVEVKGNVIGSVGPNTLGKVKTLKLTQKEGKQTVKECEGKKAGLTASLNGGAFVEAGEATEETLTGAKETELMDK
jgi:opacity protein-like surface antigen